MPLKVTKIPQHAPKAQRPVQTKNPISDKLETTSKEDFGFLRARDVGGVLTVGGGVIFFGRTGRVGDGGTKRIVSSPQCGHGTVVFSAVSSWLASNSILPLQCWQGQVT
jgi:hypothetical protein